MLGHLFRLDTKNGWIMVVWYWWFCLTALGGATGSCAEFTLQLLQSNQLLHLFTAPALRCKSLIGRWGALQGCALYLKGYLLQLTKHPIVKSIYHSCRLQSFYKDNIICKNSMYSIPHVRLTLFSCQGVLKLCIIVKTLYKQIGIECDAFYVHNKTSLGRV